MAFLDNLKQIGENIREAIGRVDQAETELVANVGGPGQVYKAIVLDGAGTVHQSAITNAPINVRITLVLGDPPDPTQVGHLRVSVLVTGLVRNRDGTTEPIGVSGRGFIVLTRYGFGNLGLATYAYSATVADLAIGSSNAVAIESLNVVVLNAPYIVPQGTLWCVAQQFVTIQNASVITRTLFADYVSGQQPGCYPGSPIRRSIDGQGYMRLVLLNLTGITPGNTIMQLVPAFALWRLHWIRSLYTPDATPAPRRIYPIVVRNAQFFGNHEEFLPPSDNLDPSTPRTVQWIDSLTQTVPMLDTIQYKFIPPGCVVSGNNGDSIGVVVVGSAAGDLFNSNGSWMAVEEWIDWGALVSG